MTCRAPESVAPDLIGFYEDLSGTNRESRPMSGSKFSGLLTFIVKFLPLLQAPSIMLVFHRSHTSCSRWRT